VPGDYDKGHARLLYQRLLSKLDAEALREENFECRGDPRRSLESVACMSIADRAAPNAALHGRGWDQEMVQEHLTEFAALGISSHIGTVGTQYQGPHPS
jgi:hypothetical protein